MREGAKILLDNEVNLSVDSVPQMDLNALVNPDRSGVADDENSPSPNAGRRIGNSHVDYYWCTVHLAVVWCGRVAGRGLVR